MTASRAPGRPRDPDRDRGILDAALRLLLERGYHGLTIEGVAEAAGVTRATVYRRHADRSALAAAALEHMAGQGTEPMPAGARDGVRHLLRGAARGLASRGGFALVGTLLAEEQHDASLVTLFRRHVLRPREARVIVVLAGGVRSGEVRADADLPLVVDLLFGALLARAMSGRPVDPDWVDRVVDGIWPLVAADPVDARPKVALRPDSRSRGE